MNCVPSKQNFLWEFVDEVDNTGTIKLLRDNRIALTVNGIDNGVWLAKLTGVSFYGCMSASTAESKCWVRDIHFSVNINGENIQMHIDEHYGLGLDESFVEVTVRGWTHRYEAREQAPGFE
jgi:hypothetical protein